MREVQSFRPSVSSACKLNVIFFAFPIGTHFDWTKSEQEMLLGMYRISGIIRYPVRNQVSGWIQYPGSSTKHPVLSGILYQVESHIRYYPVQYQLLPNTTDF